MRIRPLRTWSIGGTVRTRLVLILTLAIVPPAALSISQSTSDYAKDVTAIERDLLNVAQIVTDERAKLINGAQQVLKALSAQESIRLGLQPTCTQTLRAISDAIPQFDSLTISDRNGTVICASRPEWVGLDVSKWDWFTASLDSRDIVESGIVDSDLTLKKSIVIANPLLDSSGDVIGVLALTLSWISMLALPRHVDLPADAFTMLVDTQGQAIPLDQSNNIGFPSLLKADLVRSTGAKSLSLLHTTDGDGRRLVLAVTPLPSQKVHLLLGRPATSLFSATRLKLAGRLAMPFLILAAALLTAWIAADRMFVRWIIYLQRLASIYASGRYSVRPQNIEPAPTELRLLGESLGQLMEAIATRDRRLNEELAHRETLIKEIHHRVKNNLQIIASLINLQGRRLSDQKARDTMFDLRRRVDALALVHRSIYEADDLEHVDLKKFFDALIQQLRDLIDVDPRQIALSVEMPRRAVSADIAIALAMLVTEAVTNAFKHAFDGRSVGVVAVSLKPNQDGSAILTIADDGIGTHAPDAVEEKSEGLGRTLLAGIARQLSGELSIDGSNGTAVRLYIPHFFEPSGLGGVQAGQ